MSLFRRKKSSSKLKSNERQSPLPRSSSGSFSSPQLLDQATPPTLHVDDFGRPIDRPAFSTPQPDRTFGNGFGVGDDREFGSPSGSASPQEMQLLYGYAPLGTQLELGITKVEDIVKKCAIQIRERGESLSLYPRSTLSKPMLTTHLSFEGLDTPLIMSSRALDISLEGNCSLIRSYLEDSQSWENGSFSSWLQL